jgi:hypothetical protein
MVTGAGPVTGLARSGGLLPADQAPGVAAACVGGQLLGAVEVEHLGLAATRDRNQIPVPEAHELQAQVE